MWYLLHQPSVGILPPTVAVSHLICTNGKRVSIFWLFPAWSSLRCLPRMYLWYFMIFHHPLHSCNLWPFWDDSHTKLKSLWRHIIHPESPKVCMDMAWSLQDLADSKWDSGQPATCKGHLEADIGGKKVMIFNFQFDAFLGRKLVHVIQTDLKRTEFLQIFRWFLMLTFLTFQKSGINLSTHGFRRNSVGPVFLSIHPGV